MGFGFWGLGFGVWALGVWDLGFGGLGLGFRVACLEVRNPSHCFGFRVSCSEILCGGQKSKLESDAEPLRFLGFGYSVKQIYSVKQMRVYVEQLRVYSVKQLRVYMLSGGEEAELELSSSRGLLITRSSETRRCGLRSMMQRHASSCDAASCSSCCIMHDDASSTSMSLNLRLIDF